MKRLMAALLIVAAASLAHGEYKQDSEVLRVMRKVHKGKDAPFQQLTFEKSLKKDIPWEDIARSLPALEEMRDVLSKPEHTKELNGYGVSAYRRSVAALGVALKGKDRDAAAKAVRSLSASCALCHNYYVPGFADGE